MINSSKKLYRATITAMVFAEDEGLAKVALFSGLDYDNATVNIALADSTPTEWYNAIPFGGADEDMTVGEILREMHR